MTFKKTLGRIAPWIILVALVAAYAGVSMMMKTADEATQGRVSQLPLPVPVTKKTTEPIKKATLEPGRVVELQTSKGIIDFVLLEKDCPKTTSQIAGLVADGSYNGVKFGRVEKNTLIQTDQVKKATPGLGIEIPQGMKNAKGAVGMAMVAGDNNSARSSFYILIEPQPRLDEEFTVFGRLIRGMDVAMKIKKDDIIKTARIRPSTPDDIAQFHHVLQLEVERKVGE